MHKYRFFNWLIPCVIILFYFAIHLLNLTKLPVFADEAIYIRWAQLILDDWQQYLFFPLNDGKTPLMIWLMVPFLQIISNPLLAGRLVSVLVGFAQMGVIASLIKSFGGRKKTQWLGMMFVAVLPFWYFHHRMALMDGMLTLWMSLTYLGTIHLFSAKKRSKKVLWLAITGLSLGLGLWTKLPALLIIPTLPLLLFLESKDLPQKSFTFHNLVFQLIWLAGAIFIGGGMFASLKIHPAFSQLFGRGSDFLFPWKEVLLAGGWQTTIKNIPTYIGYFTQYLTWPIVALAILGLFFPRPAARKHQHILFWSAMVYIGPIALLGRVVYPRYFLPAVPFLTVSVSILIQHIIDRYITPAKKTAINVKQLTVTIVLVLIIANLFTLAAQFIFYSLSDPHKIPFVSADKEQYLYEWSSGHGISQTVQYIQDQAQDHSIAVATEGSFGTLPDGILMYLHNQDVQNIYVEGIGYPVKALTPAFVQRAQEFDQVILVVNSHRMELTLPAEQQLRQYCRPDYAPCLQVWEITPQLSELPVKD